MADEQEELATAAHEPNEVSFDVQEPTPKPRQHAEKKPDDLAQVQPQKQRTDMVNPQAIHQNSQNPDVEPPPDTQYIAQQNNRVQEETVARVTNYTQHDDQISTPQLEQSQSQEQGNASQDDVADAQKLNGSNERAPTPDEVQRQEQSPPSKIARSEHVREESTQTRDSASFEVRDPFGTVSVRTGKSSNRRVKNGSNAKLSLGYTDYVKAFGEEQVEQERRAAIEARQSRSPGRARERSWQQFRAALENYTPSVRRGNQTALNAAASPFANYLAAVHMRIHREFADRFLAGIPVGSPMNDDTLNTKLEIVLNEDGTVYDVGIVHSSGVLTFDYGAFNAVMKAQPYPRAPKEILSGDARVYFHWGFYRNERQCGTFNAEPYILPDPPKRAPRKDWLHDNPTVPGTSTPQWGTQPASGENKAKKEDNGIRAAPAPQGATLG